MAVNKPRGLADARPRSPAVTSVIEDFEYRKEDSESEIESDGDDLEYPGNLPESLVRPFSWSPYRYQGQRVVIKVTIKSTVAVKVSNQDAKNSRPRVHSLPSGMRRTFSEMFVPTVLEEVGCSATPWVNPDVNSLQRCVDTVYPGVDYTVQKGDPLDVSVSRIPGDFLPLRHILTLTQTSSRVMTFRNMIATTALINVKNFLVLKFKDPERVEEYVKSGLLYYGEIPFLYRAFQPSDIPCSKEKGGYKVVSTNPRSITERPRAHSPRLAVDLSRTSRLLTPC
jgi:hypothetical protein